MNPSHQEKKHGLRNIILGAMAVLILSQAITFILAFSSFENTFKTSLVSRYQFFGTEMKKKIETSLNFGKPFYKYAGMDLLFQEFISKDNNITDFYITDTNHTTLYATQEDLVGKPVPFLKKTSPSFSLNISEKQDDAQSSTRFLIEKEKSTLIAFPLYLNQTKMVGTLYLEFSNQFVLKTIQETLKTNIRYLVIFLIGFLLLLWFLLWLLSKKAHQTFVFFKKRLSFKVLQYAVIIFVLLGSQITYTLFNISYFKKNYFALIDNNLHSFSKIVKENIQTYLDLGLKIERLKKLEFFLMDRVQAIPECESMMVLNTDNQVLYLANQDKHMYSVLELDAKKNFHSLEQKKEGIIELPLIFKNEVQGFLLLKPNQTLIQEKAFNIFLDTITVVVIAMVFSLQLMALFSLIFYRSRKDNKDLLTRVEQEEKESRSMKIIKLASFIFFFGETIPLSFLPLYIQQLYLENPISFLGFSQEALLSIPISTFMFGVSIFVLATGSLSRKFSSRKIFLICVPFLVLGALFSSMATNIIQLAFFRFISGLGYGGSIITGISLVVENTHKGNRTAGFGYWSAGYAAGFICATAMGGVIAERLGFRAGLLVSSLFGVLFGLFVFFFVQKKSIKKIILESAPVAKVKNSLKDFVALFKNQSLMIALFCVSVPVQMAFIGVFQYSFPLYMGTMGISPSNIGRLLTIYALISLLTPYIGKLADKYRNEKIFIIIGNLISGLALLLFMVSQDIIMLIFVIMAIGVGGTFVDATEEAYITSSKEAKTMGEARLLSIYTTYEKIIAILVPIIAGALINILGYSQSIALMGGFILIGVFFFALFSKNLRQLHSQKEELKDVL